MRAKSHQFQGIVITFALRQAETGTRVEEICRKLGVSQATFFNWKRKFGSMGVAEFRRLRQLEEENAQFTDNHKLVYRIYRQKDLILQTKRHRRKRSAAQRQERIAATGINPGLEHGFRG